MASNEFTRPKAPHEDFDNIGKEHNTYTNVYNTSYENIDPKEQSFMLKIFQPLCGHEGRHDFINRIRNASFDGLDSLAECSVTTFEQFCNPSHFTRLPTIDDCSICFQEIEHGQRIMTTDCEHAFHQECLSTWLLEKFGYENCPGCRTPIEKVRCGRYDKATRRMSSAHAIRVLCAVPEYRNIWRVVQLEYQQNNAIDQGHPDFARIITDERFWYIHRPGSLRWTRQDKHAHPTPARYEKWYDEFAKSIDKRNEYYNEKLKAVQKEIRLPTRIIRELVEGYVPIRIAEHARSLRGFILSSQEVAALYKTSMTPNRLFMDYPNLDFWCGSIATDAGKAVCPCLGGDLWHNFVRKHSKAEVLSDDDVRKIVWALKLELEFERWQQQQRLKARETAELESVD